ncbi:carbamoyltransferase HypF [Seonamhaeicola sp.]|uniref:carbamoyltransferase HypF n=1 Tax=Seonamhaeicola sp. TaxID=1912245 RepID=UPI002621C199|nr:carbamoyltransferase HypF [Seonamhaeicola sp.]
MLKTYKLTVSGQVQGVGFRPYVFTLAKTFSLKGTVSNNEEGVIIFLYGIEENIEAFCQKLIHEPPPVAKIKSHHLLETETQSFDDFRIVPSEKGGQLNLPLTPDFAICEDCKSEIEDSKNRRNQYPFTTCVNCGPRWSITETFPFERAHTSIDEFPMCETCLDEYTNPSDRRFHSQTNTCSTCGIQLYLCNSNGETLETGANIFVELSGLLKQGQIIALKNTSGYLLCCNAEDAEVVKRLRRLKQRPKKPFAILYPSLKKLQSELEVSDVSVSSLISTESPINIVSLENYKGKIALREVAPGLKQLGVMLPYTAILQLLANQLDFPIVATSGNIHGSPIISNEKEALSKLKHIADCFLQHNLRINHPQDDSVLKFSFKHQKPCLFRRSRGYAPNYLQSAIKSEEKILAMGADLKSSVAFLPNEHLYISQYMGNLESLDVYERFTSETNAFINIFEQAPEVIIIDKHPKYFSSQFGRELSKKYNTSLLEVQHHKAHFMAVMGEYQLFNVNEKILGVIWDGTGYGDDGQIWGGEFFEYNNRCLSRINHFEYFNWIAGDKMSKEPRLSLLSMIDDKKVESKFAKEEFAIYQTLKKNNKLKTSSVGRLFDAVASLLDITDYNTYEGEAAILLENGITGYDLVNCKSYVDTIDSGISGTDVLKGVFEDLNNGLGKEQIISNFLFTLADIILKVADKSGYKHICCSGGVFQNTTLLDMLIDLNNNTRRLYFNSNFTPNDENIAFGQLMYYLNCRKS